MFRLNSRISTGIVFLVVSSAPLLLHRGNRGGSSAETQSAANAPGAPAHGPASARARPGPDATTADEPALVKTAEDGGAAQGQAELQAQICSFLTEYGKTQPPTKNGLFCSEAAERSWRVVIAILPDPAHTHLALRFDRSIDDIQDAIQSLGWTFDHSWLPWDNKTHAESNRFQKRESDVADQQGQENNPGVLLFRGGDQGKGQPYPLIILVVSDTPTGGVNPKQFHAAMNTWRLLTQLPAKTPPVLSILGPTFSGSVDSLRQLLSQELELQPVMVAAKPAKQAPKAAVPETTAATNKCTSYVPPQVEIASGTITSGDRMSELNIKPNDCLTLKTTPVSFAMDAKYQSDQLFSFLRDHKLNGKFAELEEAESAFGTRRQNDNCSTDKDCIFLHFPREISHLRNAYEQSSIIGFGNSSNTPKAQLSLNIGMDTHDDDAVAEFSGQQQTLAMETEMAQIATTLNREHVSTVLVSATDVLDEIFVARYLQRQAPRVTVIINDADLLFLRSGDDAGLESTYVASPWPLIEENERWSSLDKDSSTLHLYQSQGDEGLHNAAVYLLGSGPDKSGSENTKISEYRAPVGLRSSDLNSRPPLWLSVIGRGRFVPIALVDADQGERNTSETNLPALTDPGVKPAQTSVETNGIHERLALPIKLVTAFIALLLFWHGAAILRSRIDRRFGWTYALADKEHRVKRLWLQAAVSFVAIPALALLWIPHSEHLYVQTTRFQICLFGLQCIAILLVMWTPYNLIRGVDGPPEGECEEFWLKLLVLQKLCRSEATKAVQRPFICPSVR